jgi:hypothetical protein
MSVIQDIISEEYQRLSSLEKRFKSRLSHLPKGVLSIKERGSKKYAYLSFRDLRGKVVSQYIGIASDRNDGKIKELELKIKERKELEKKLKNVRSQVKEIKRHVRRK